MTDQPAEHEHERTGQYTDTEGTDVFAPEPAMGTYVDENGEMHDHGDRPGGYTDGDGTERMTPAAEPGMYTDEESTDH